eukprot:COSAG05_NODE_16570_length_343_cov_0.618852_1_plen_72_part_01
MKVPGAIIRKKLPMQMFAQEDGKAPHGMENNWRLIEPKEPSVAPPPAPASRGHKIENAGQPSISSAVSASAA